MTTTLLSRRRWIRGSRNQNIILPLRIVDPNGFAEKDILETPISAATTTIGSPSSVKMLFPSISMFNLPTSSLPTSPIAESAVSPPPQFAVDHKRHRLKALLTPRKRGLQKAYPSAFETFLFDDTTPGAPAQGIRPVRLLIERLQAWYLLAKRLLHHFEVLASVETRVAKTYRHLDKVAIFPPQKRHHHYSRHSNKLTKRKRKRYYKDQRLLHVHFAFQGGVRSVCDAWQMYHSNTTTDHAEFATFLRNEAIPTLANIKRELKWMIKSIRSDDRLSLRTLTKLKKEAAKRLKRLDRQLVFFDQHPYHAYFKQDPWLMNAAVVKQMIKVYRQENKIHETVLRLQRETLISEEQLIEEFRRLCQHIYSMREQSTLGIDRGLGVIMETFNKMNSDWHNFCQQNNQHLVSETAAFRHPDYLQYPNHSHALLQPIFAARMERKSLVLHHWHEYIYVLTPAGFLHEYRDSKNYPSKPDSTIFVPHYKASSLSTNLHHNLIFQLQPHKTSRNMLTNQLGWLPKEWRTTKARLGIRDRYTWTLRAKSALDMETWVQHLNDSSERYRPSTVNHLPSIAPEIVISGEEIKEEEAVIVAEQMVVTEEEATAEVTAEGEETANEVEVTTEETLSAATEEAPVEVAPIAETPNEEPPTAIAEENTVTEEAPESPIDTLVIE